MSSQEPVTAFVALPLCNLLWGWIGVLLGICVPIVTIQLYHKANSRHKEITGQCVNNSLGNEVYTRIREEFGHSTFRLADIGSPAGVVTIEAQVATSDRTEPPLTLGNSGTGYVECGVTFFTLAVFARAASGMFASSRTESSIIRPWLKYLTTDLTGSFGQPRGNAFTMARAESPSPFGKLCATHIELFATDLTENIMSQPTDRDSLGFVSALACTLRRTESLPIMSAFVEKWRIANFTDFPTRLVWHTEPSFA